MRSDLEGQYEQQREHPFFSWAIIQVSNRRHFSPVTIALSILEKAALGKAL